ncbi:hypothetical protein Xenpb_02587 [Xenorhabdus sp. PB62.4]|nr:hypothetical protein [Xenorhabdus sp. PB62.4]
MCTFFQCRQVLLLGYHTRASGIFQNKLDSLRWIFGRNRHIGTAGFQHRQNTDHHLQTAIEVEGYWCICLHWCIMLLLVTFAYHNSELICLFVELTVGQSFLFEYQRHIIGCCCCLNLKLLLQNHLLRVGDVGLVPAVQ